MGEDYPMGVVYTVDDDNFIVGEFQCDFSYAVAAYMGQRDHMGRRYIIRQFGKSTEPYKRKPKRYFTVPRQPDSSEASTAQ